MSTKKLSRGISIKEIVSKPDFPRHLEKMLRNFPKDIDEIIFLQQLFAAYIELAKKGINYSKSQVKKSKKPRGSIFIDEEKRVKHGFFIEKAFKNSGEGANTPEVMDQLFGILEDEGMHPLDKGAKNSRYIEATDAKNNPIQFTYSTVQRTLREIRPDRSNRGRPRIKQQ